MKSIIFSIFTSLTLSMAATILSSCSSSGDSATAGSSWRVKDREAYRLGEHDAAEIIRYADDEDFVQESLLEVRARRTNIESKLGRQSAVDYSRGFTEYINKNCDSISRIIN